MRVLRGDLRGWEAPEQGTALTVGVYDGVHRGHQEVLRQLSSLAARAELALAVLTFDPHPLALVAPERVPPLLTTLEQRLDLLAASGVEVAAVLPFTWTVRAMSPEEFVREVLVGALRGRCVMVGEDFRFGRDRAGDIDTLAHLGDRYGLQVGVVGLVEVDGRPISSTVIRRAIIDGDLESANQALGRCYELRGTVVRGDGRGAEMGYPTANLTLPSQVAVPAKGVYAGWALTEGELYRAAASVGIRPTFETDRRLVVEAYLLDFEGHIYGREMQLAFCFRLRDEEKFESAEALVAQMDRDVARVRRLLVSPPAWRAPEHP